LGIRLESESSGGDVHDGDGVNDILNYLSFRGRNIGLRCSRTAYWEEYFELRGRELTANWRKVIRSPVTFHSYPYIVNA